MSKLFSSLIWDYVVFAILLSASTIFPLWKDITGRKGGRTKANYVFATGRVSMLPMMLSIARGTLGVRAFLGYPSELFYRGAGMWETLYGVINAYPIVCFIFVPVYCNLDITSVYHYLDLRFHSKLVRRMASLTFIVRNALSLGITVYTPCVALNTIVGIPYWASLSATTVISIIFTMLGGLKAAITADAVQGLTLIFVSFACIAQGSYESGGVKDVYQISKDNGRLEFLNFSGDITTRVDTLSAWTGQFFISLSILGCQQNLVQRYLSMKSVNEVRRTLVANIPFTAFLFSLAWIVGMAVYTTYYNCDPLEAGYTERIDSILPFFVNDKLSYIPGFMGLFLGTLFNGALCMNVSNINSLATVTWEDFLSTQKRFKGYEDKKQLSAIKHLSIIYAVVIMGIAYCVGFLSGVIEGAMLANSATTGPLVGAFILAMLIPCANGRGTAVGMIAAHIIVIILIFGSYTVTKAPLETLPTSIEGCTTETFSPWIKKVDSSWLLKNSLLEIDWEQNHTSSFHLPPNHEKSWSELIFGISYMYYSMVGTITTIMVAIIVSYFTKSDDDEFDEKLLHPMILKIRNFLTCQRGDRSNATKASLNNDEENQRQSQQHYHHQIGKTAARTGNEIESGSQATTNAAFVHDDSKIPTVDVNKSV